MRRLKRNQITFIYATVKEMTEKVDAQGYRNGHRDVVYNEPVTAKGCVVYRGTSNYKPYGINEEWSLAVIPDNPLVITVGTRITIDGKDYYVMSYPTTMNEQRIYCR